MKRKRNSLVPIAEALADLDGPVQALRETLGFQTGIDGCERGPLLRDNIRLPRKRFYIQPVPVTHIAVSHLHNKISDDNRLIDYVVF